MKETLSELQKTMSSAVYEAVKNAHKIISKGHEKLQKKRENKVSIQNYLSMKDEATPSNFKKDLVILNDLKTNKHDTE